jgi:NADH:ubiquinone oxidoreductase subunit 2 (subunit N)
MLITIPLEPTAVERANRLFAGDTLVAFGRPLVMTEGIRSLFLLLFAALSILFLLSMLKPQGQHFVPASLAALAPLAGALMVRPFAFGAPLLLLAMAILVAAIQAERVTSTGAALRFLLISVLAIPLFQIAGWMLSGEQLSLLQPASILILIASITLLAGFPFHIWVTPVVVEASAMATVFIFGLVQLVVMVFISGLISASPSVQRAPIFLSTIRASGAATMLIAALLTVTANDLRRWLAAFLLLDMGTTLLTLSIGGSDGMRLFLTMQLARVIALLMVAVGLTLIAGNGDALFSSLSGRGRQRPLGLGMLVLGCASLLGLPLTVGFPGRWEMILVAQQGAHPPWLPYHLLLAMIVGSAGLLRGIASCLAPSDEDAESAVGRRTWLQGVALLLALFGGWLAINPQHLSNYAADLASLIR